jgi:protein-S-isoprenylcysteine O-methyltransferase Ste14
MSAARLVATAIYLLVWPALIFVLAGTWRWAEGWIFGAWFVALCTTCIVWLYRRDPALLAERYRLPGSGGQAGWDRFVVIGLGLGFATWIALIPLDARRFGWTSRWPIAIEGCGAALLLLSSFFFFRSFTDNPFLSPLVRIQPERKQRVVSTGVYGFVRHPMYLGALLMFFGAPLLMSSVAGLLCAAALALLLAGRIVGEERLLVRELEGYVQYRDTVRYRLIPHVW